MQAIECLSNSNVSFGINWVARSDNLMDFPNIIKIAEKYNANNILVVGNKLSNNGILESPLTYSELVYLNSIISSYERNSNKIKIIIQQCYTELNLIHGMSSIPINNGCSSGRIFCAINCKKQFMPCTHLPYYEEYDSINEYWEKSTILKDLREFTPKSLRTCDACVYKDKCVFCRATNAITVADLKSEPISCIFNEIK